MVKPQQGDSEQIPMSKRPVYRVASAGLDPRDVRLIEIVFRHSQYNRYDFRVIDGLDLTRTDILIANPADPAGLDALIAVRSFPRPIPSVNAVPRGAQAAARYSITIDRLTLQLLPILNRVVESEQLQPVAPPDDAPAACVPASLPAREAEEAQADARRGEAEGTEAVAPAGEAAGGDAPAQVEVACASAPEAQIAAAAADADEAIAVAIAPGGVAIRSSEAAASATAASAIAQAAGRAAASSGSRALAHLASLATPGNDEMHDRSWMELVTRAPSPARLRAVVVDPSAAARQQLARALGRMGLEVHGFDGIGAAVQDLAARHADIVIAEACLVDGDGFELVRRLRALPAYRFTPVLLLRSRMQLFDSARARLAREVTLLAKPVRRADLEAIVRDCLRSNAVLDDIEELLAPG